MAAHKGPASLRRRCIWGGSCDANLPSTVDMGAQLYTLSFFFVSAQSAALPLVV
jgi:hypothetical protein